MSFRDCEPACWLNSVTAFLGLMIVLSVWVRLCRRVPGKDAKLKLAIFCGGVLASNIASLLYHAKWIPGPDVTIRRWLDNAAISVFIGVTVAGLPAVIPELQVRPWLAKVNFFLTLFVPMAKLGALCLRAPILYERLDWLYIVHGWIPGAVMGSAMLVAAQDMVRMLLRRPIKGTPRMMGMLAAGMLFTSGFAAFQRLDYMAWWLHGVWHLYVQAATVALLTIAWDGAGELRAAAKKTAPAVTYPEPNGAWTPAVA